MKNRYVNGRALASLVALGGLLLVARATAAQQGPSAQYKVLAGISQGNLTVFPVVSNLSHDTGLFLTLDEGIRSGKVVVQESGGQAGLVRPRPGIDDGVWRERQLPMGRHDDARVNELSIVNNADQPLLLLAGEIVTGGKQDRVVGKDRIIPAHSQPIALSVFCVEPHRWTATSIGFGTTNSLMAQPSVRSKAMAEQNQSAVWNEVAKSRDLFIAAAPRGDARAMQSTSSYAATLQNESAKRRIDVIATPLEQTYEKLLDQLWQHNAVGAVIAVNQEVIWADTFASASLLEKYWPKLIRSYAAEAISPQVGSGVAKLAVTANQAQNFLNQMDTQHETVESEPGLFRNTEIDGDNFEAFILTSLLPNTGFNVHLAKMKRERP